MNASIAGLTTLQSGFSTKETMDRLESEIRGHGMEVFARIDHAAGAIKAGLELLPTEVIIFGQARGGTPLMRITQTIGIDLPLKALAWEDSAGQRWLSYLEPSWIAERHGVGADADAVVKGLDAALSFLARRATDAQ
jgi:uncharacterized protein (DUF302 family)